VLAEKIAKASGLGMRPRVLLAADFQNPAFGKRESKLRTREEITRNPDIAATGYAHP